MLLDSGIYLFEMTTIENNVPHQNDPLLGIYLLEMTATENLQLIIFLRHLGIDLLEMTTTEKPNKKYYILDWVFTCLK